MTEKLPTNFGKTKIHSADSGLPQAERVLVVPGFSEGVDHNGELVDALAGKGFDALTYSQPRRKGKGSDGDGDGDAIQRQANVLLEVVEKTVPQGEKVHAVAHSLGSAAILRAAQQYPGRFASITLMQPVGMVGEQGLVEQTGRVGTKVVRNQGSAIRGQDPNRQPKSGYAAGADAESRTRFSGRVTSAQLAGSGLILRQPALAVREAKAAGSYDIADDLKKVAELGIAIDVVTSQSDEMFDADKADAGYTSLDTKPTSYSRVADPAAGHDTFWMQPERTAEIARQIIQKT